MSLNRRPALWLLAALLPMLAAALALHGWRMHEALHGLWSERNHLAVQEVAHALAEGDARGLPLEESARSVFAARGLHRLSLHRGDAQVLELEAPAASTHLIRLAAPAPGRSALARWPGQSVRERSATQVRVSAPGDDLQEALQTSIALTAALAFALAALGAGAWLFAACSAERAAANLVAQAQAMQRGEFSEQPEPRRGALRALARELNALVRRLHTQFHDQAEQVAQLQRLAQCDAVSGLPLRALFIRQLAGMLGGEGAPPAALLIVRAPGLAQLNEAHGREATDRFIAALADVLMTYAERVPGAAAGRLNGSDFALALPVAGAARETAQAISAALAAAPAARLAGAGFRIAGCDGLQRLEAGAALALADRALAEAELAREIVVLGDGSATNRAASEPPMGARAHREQLARALAEGRVQLAEFALTRADGTLVHLECPLRVQMEPGGEYQRARRWLASAARGQLLPQADLAGLDLALAAIRRDALARCVHISLRSFRMPAFAALVQARLEAAGATIASQLWIEWTELDGSEDAAETEALRRAWPGWRRLGVRLGMEHAGASPRTLAGLKALGLDFVKVDARHVAGAADDDAVREYARGLVALIHGLGMLAFAEGADELRDLQALWPLGFDGATGAAVRLASAPLVST
jgi:EAL domain-containing protein (putative c-di-GMP-specific phosphodiesterase class I)/GGDEF domain-containing protein